ncbi:hypothetical protein IMZ48_03000 [Candidatus Bathyarchaeota archaeon]|nr:hypothetical protein [Candidatus Bathyarchaeota archaeon]
MIKSITRTPTCLENQTTVGSGYGKKPRPPSDKPLHITPLPSADWSFPAGEWAVRHPDGPHRENPDGHLRPAGLGELEPLPIDCLLSGFNSRASDELGNRDRHGYA